MENLVFMQKVLEILQEKEIKSLAREMEVYANDFLESVNCEGKIVDEIAVHTEALEKKLTKFANDLADWIEVGKIINPENLFLKIYYNLINDEQGRTVVAIGVKTQNKEDYDRLLKLVWAKNVIIFYFITYEIAQLDTSSVTDEKLADYCEAIRFQQNDKDQVLLTIKQLFEDCRKEGL